MWADREKAEYRLNQQQTLILLKKQCGTILKTHRCHLCKASDTIPRNWKKRGRGGFTIHHLIYREGEKIHSDFEKSLKGRISYYEYLLPIVKKFPKKFRYLCNKCHFNFSKHFDKNRMGDTLLRKMMKLRRETKWQT